MTTRCIYNKICKPQKPKAVPASQSQRYSLDESAEYQYHHSMQHLDSMSM